MVGRSCECHSCILDLPPLNLCSFLPSLASFLSVYYYTIELARSWKNMDVENKVRKGEKRKGIASSWLVLDCRVEMCENFLAGAVRLHICSLDL